MRVFDGRPPCTVKLILEGMEETESNLEAFVEAHPELFVCDLFIVCDMGNLRVGDPVFTTALRGDVACIVTVSTLQHTLHSGVFGWPAPDAMMSLAMLFMAFVFDGRTTSEKALRWVFMGCFALNSIAFALYSGFYGIYREYRFEIATISINWLTLIISGIFLSIVFRGALSKAFPKT